MVLWEITLATAYFLGLRRTYRLALRIERRLLFNHPRLRDFAHRRTRSIFDVALRVHRSIQERDISIGRSLGNWVLRKLDNLRPQAKISGVKKPSPPHEQHIVRKEESGERKMNFVRLPRDGGLVVGVGVLSGAAVRPTIVSPSLPHFLLKQCWMPLKKNCEHHQHRYMSSSSSFSSSVSSSSAAAHLL